MNIIDIQSGGAKMEKKPELVVKLFAGEVLVDQSTDPGLWQRVLAEIRGISLHPEREPAKSPQVPKAAPPAGGPVSTFARAIDVSVEELEGGLAPQADAPFIFLDDRSWEALKRNTPARGPGTISPGVLTATALLMWQKHQQIGDITLQTVRAAMSTIDLDDPNVSRALNNCDWLQVRGGRIVLNPARTSAAARLLRAYCRREAMSDSN